MDVLNTRVITKNTTKMTDYFSGAHDLTRIFTKKKPPLILHGQKAANELCNLELFGYGLCCGSLCCRSLCHRCLCCCLSILL